MIGSISAQIIRPEIMLYKSQRVWDQNSKLSFTISIERVLSCDVVRQLWFKPRREKTFDRIRDKPTIGAPRGFGELGRRAIYFQGAGEHCLLF